MIFGIGLSKTATTSLFAALDHLGYRTGTYRHMRQLGLSEWFDGDFTTDYLSGFEALTDLPVATWFPELDRRYPGSRFILTVRDVDAWLESARKHFEVPPANAFSREVRLATYGMTGFNPERFRWVFERHQHDVATYFRDRPDDLLTLNVTGGEGWKELCTFLDRPVPDGPFPNVQPGHRLPHEQAAT